MYLNTKLNLVYKIYYEKNKYVHKLHQYLQQMQKPP